MLATLLVLPLLLLQTFLLPVVPKLRALYTHLQSQSEPS